MSVGYGGEGEMENSTKMWLLSPLSDCVQLVCPVTGGNLDVV